MEVGCGSAAGIGGGKDNDAPSSEVRVPEERSRPTTLLRNNDNGNDDNNVDNDIKNCCHHKEGVGGVEMEERCQPNQTTPEYGAVHCFLHNGMATATTMTTRMKMTQ